MYNVIGRPSWLPVSRDIVSPIRWISLSPRIESTGIEYPLKTKIRHKTQNVNAKHLQCQCIVSGRSCGPSPHIYDIYLFLQRATVWKNWLRKLRTVALTVYFMVLNFDYGIQLSIIHVYKYCFMPVTLYPSVVILRGGIDVDRNRVSPQIC